jgi:predicted nuclease of predicted toxin-antitoxin system
MPVSASLLSVLEARGHEGVHALQLGLDRAPDEDLLALARREQRVVITADLDFPRLPPGKRIKPGPSAALSANMYSDEEMHHLLERVLKAVDTEVLERSICVVDSQRVRITRAAPAD